MSSTSLNFCVIICYWLDIIIDWTLLCPRPVGGAEALSGDRRPSSVRPSVCLMSRIYIGSNSKTKRPRKTKLCTGVPQVTCDSHTDFKVKRSKVKVGRGNIVAATLPHSLFIESAFERYWRVDTHNFTISLTALLLTSFCIAANKE